MGDIAILAIVTLERMHANDNEIQTCIPRKLTDYGNKWPAVKEKSMSNSFAIL